MTNHHTKLEDPWAMSFLVIDWTRFVYGPTDLPTDGQTFENNILPLHKNRGHKNVLSQIVDLESLAPHCCGFQYRQGLWIPSCEEAIQLAHST